MTSAKGFKKENKIKMIDFEEIKHEHEAQRKAEDDAKAEKETFKEQRAQEIEEKRQRKIQLDEERQQKLVQKEMAAKKRKPIDCIKLLI
jgi:hypothetical protein